MLMHYEKPGPASLSFQSHRPTKAEVPVKNNKGREPHIGFTVSSIIPNIGDDTK